MSTLRTITNFKSKLAGGGARPNLFEVELAAMPAYVTGYENEEQERFAFLCKTAALPASNIAPIEIPFRGRTLKVAGDRTFDVWTVTIINDEDFRLRSAFELWMNGISKLNNATGATAPGSYMVDARVHQLGRGAGTLNSTTNADVTGGTSITPLRTYKFVDIFPTNISQIDLSYDASDTIEEYTVEFQVQHWEAESTGSAPAIA
jgi:hypothetical protein